MDKTDELLRIMARLRADDGCPWDREQTHETLKPYLIEEAYELIDAIDVNDDDGIKDELGDVLLQVVFHSQIAEDEGRFDYADVVRNVCDKLIRRHPHVFDTATVEDAEGVVKQWGQIKKEENKKKEYGRQSALDGIPNHLPALAKATQIQRKAAQLSFEWPEVAGVLDKIEEEIAELREAIESGDQDAVQDEIGDLFFAMVNLSRFEKVDAEEALRRSCRKFDRRFRHIEERVSAADKEFHDFTLDELEEFWVEAKELERSG